MGPPTSSNHPQHLQEHGLRWAHPLAIMGSGLMDFTYLHRVALPFSPQLIMEAPLGCGLYHTTHHHGPWSSTKYGAHRGPPRSAAHLLSSELGRELSSPCFEFLSDLLLVWYWVLLLVPLCLVPPVGSAYFLSFPFALPCCCYVSCCLNMWFIIRRVTGWNTVEWRSHKPI